MSLYVYNDYMSIVTRPILIIDAMNLFVRSFNAYPSMNSNGEPSGGCIGFLKTMRRIINEAQPSTVYVAWEGGGSQRRRKLFPEYKLNRKPEKLNRFYEDDLPESDENKKSQIVSLLGLLKCTPTCQLYASDCEADDVIGFLCCGPLKDTEKIIVSSDKDMYQLLNNKTKVYSLHKKMYVTKEDVLEEFRVTSENFALAKALCGDPSDNIPGVKGLGFKTVAKRFPFLGTEQSISMQDIFDYCHTHIDETPIYKKVLDSTSDIKRNWKLVYLDGSMLSANQISKIENSINTFVPNVSKMKFIKTLIKEGVSSDFDVDGFFYSFNCIDKIIYEVQ